MEAPRTLAQALDAAWERSLEAAEATGRQRQAAAQQQVAESWLAAAPALTLSRRQGRGAAADGANETEVGVALPLWRPGQRHTQAQAAEAEAGWAGAARVSARLQLAARVRELAGQVRHSEAVLAQATEQQRLLEALKADVERRVRAGDLAPTDAMAAQADALQALAQVREAELALSAQRSAWTVLTGWTLLPEPEAPLPDDEAVLAPDLDQHPDQQLAAAAELRAQQQLAQVQAQRSTAPELGLGLRQDRPGLGQPQQHSMALALRWPLGTDTQHPPRLAAALAELDVAQRARQRLRDPLAAQVALARQQRTTARALLAAEQARAEVLKQRAQLLNRSFQAGESALPELLRALSAAAQADAARARQHAALAQAEAHLRQAFGQLP